MSDVGEPLANGYQIVVEKLTKNITEAHLRSMFSRYGTILDIDLPMNRAFNTNRGTAYIVFESESAAESAFARMHEGWVDGAQISVSLVAARARMRSRSAPPAAQPEAADDGPPAADTAPRRYPRNRDREPDREPDRRYRDRSPLRGAPPRRPADTYYGAGVRGFSGERDRDPEPGPPPRRPSRSRSRSRSPYGSRSPEYGRYGRRYGRRSGSADSFERERRR